MIKENILCSKEALQTALSTEAHLARGQFATAGQTLNEGKSLRYRAEARTAGLQNGGTELRTW
jgi:hypothetical protein